MPHGRHRPKTYTLPLVETWETMRQAHPKPSRWLSNLVRRAQRR